MPHITAIIMPDTYRDSVFLMKLSSQAKTESGAEQVSAMMGTPRNMDLFASSGLASPEMEQATPEDLVIAIKGEGESVRKAEDAVRRLLNEASGPKQTARGEEIPHDLAQAVAHDPALNLAVISVAGDYARYEAAKAVSMGMDVMLYSDNIPLEDEISLKRFANRKGLLVMGPDCGTAIINGVPLAFANKAARGPVGIVAASGTGLQEVICLLDRMGVGVSNAYGTGGRDLKDDVGGISAVTALRRLADDTDTGVLALIGKPPGDKTRAMLAKLLPTLGKPVFVHYLGASDYTAEDAAGIAHAPTLTDIAAMIAKAVNKNADIASITGSPAAPAMTRPGYLRGLFGGGTLCQEAAELASLILPGEKYSNLAVKGFAPIEPFAKSKGHCFWDFGDDAFTVGRPHPMMAPELKMERMIDELCDPEVSVVLVDMVIGYGAHQDQAGEFLRALEAARAKNAEAVAATSIVASVCGTDSDIPSRANQTALLEQAGVVVCPSNASAARLAANIAAGTGAGGD